MRNSSRLTKEKPQAAQTPRTPTATIASAGNNQYLLGVSPATDNPTTTTSDPEMSTGALTLPMLSLACAHLSKVDAKLAPLITQYGMPHRLIAKTNLSHFSSLAKAIIFQQLGTRAATAIYERVVMATNCTDSLLLTPECILQAPIDVLKGAGLSERKASYLKDLAQAFSSLDTSTTTNNNDNTAGALQSIKLTDELLNKMTEEELFTALTSIKGIGPWTVHMHSMFSIGRPDVLPVGDLGVRKGMQLLYGLKELPSPAEMEALAEVWRPYRSVGSFYMWKVGEMIGNSGGGKQGGKATGQKRKKKA